MTPVQTVELEERCVEHVLVERAHHRARILELSNGDHVETFAVGLLHSCFLTNRDQMTVKVRPPLVADFSRLGLASALSRGECISAEPNNLRSPDWTRTWTRGSNQMANALFEAPPEAARPMLSGPDHATFNDPHFTHPMSGKSGLASLIRRWVYKRSKEAQRHPQVAADLASNVGYLVDQLVSNVRQHAVLDDQPPIRSQVWVQIDDKGDDRTFSLTVVDTGPGIESTLSQKLGEGAPTGTQLFRDLLSGDLQGWHRGRGVGLSCCFEMIEDTPRAEMFLATGNVRCRVRSDESHSVETTEGRLPGTLAAVTLPI